MLWLDVAHAAGLRHRAERCIPSGGFNRSIDGVLGIATDFLPPPCAWAIAARAGARRLESPSWPAGSRRSGSVTRSPAIEEMRQASLPFPSIADIFYLIFYPLILAHWPSRSAARSCSVLALDLARQRPRRRRSSLRLAVPLEPVLAQTDGSWLAQDHFHRYPVFDMLLIAAAVGVLALHGWRLITEWLWPIAGLGMFAFGDIVYALRVAHDAYHMGTVLDASWAIGSHAWHRGRVLSAATTSAQSQKPSSPCRYSRPWCAARALPQQPAARPGISVVLATITVLMAAARTQYAFRQLRRLADLARQATTDDLTGLPNRRALYQDVAEPCSRRRREPRAFCCSTSTASRR